jgi:Ca-activated chloride channel family protein
VLSFGHPERLWLLLIIPGLALWAIWGWRRRGEAWRLLAQRGRAPRDGTVLVVVSAFLLIIALAEPTWGRPSASLLPPGHDVVLAIDVSKSMGVEDAVPNRLAVAVESAESMVHALAGDPANRVAVVAFAGRAVVRCPLTENFGAVLDALHRLKPGVVSPGGTDLAAPLESARDAFGKEEHAQGRSIVLFSDGEDHLDRWSAQVERLRQENIMVHAIAIGDAEHGHPVPDGHATEKLTHNGEPVESRRIDKALEAIALGTDGSLIRLGLTTGDLGTLYRAKIEPAARRRRESANPANRAERFPLFLMAALTLLLTSTWPAKRRWSLRLPWHWGFRRRVGYHGLLVILFASLLVLGSSGQAPAPAVTESAPDAIARGQAAYRLGRWEQALAAFQAASERAPASPIPRYDAAAALYQLGRYSEARQYYLDAASRADAHLRTKIDYALGNTFLAEGDVAGAIKSYDACVASTVQGAELDAVRSDAAINRRFALEQPRSMNIPKDDRSGNEPKARKSEGRRGPNRRKNPDALPSDEEPPQESGNGGSGRQEGRDQDPKPSPRRRFGGAGGSRTTPAGATGETPEERLDAALDQIRESQKRRLPDEEPPPSQNRDHKDW